METTQNKYHCNLDRTEKHHQAKQNKSERKRQILNIDSAVKKEK